MVAKSVTLNDLERHNGHSKVTGTEMTKDQSGCMVFVHPFTVLICVYVVLL